MMKEKKQKKKKKKKKKTKEGRKNSLYPRVGFPC
jgi:hypothetical protein